MINSRKLQPLDQRGSFTLYLPLYSNVNVYYSSGDLKKQLEQVCGVPVCRQQISGLGGSRAMSSAQLHTLSLPHNAVLRLKAAEQLMADDE